MRFNNRETVKSLELNFINLVGKNTLKRVDYCEEVFKIFNNKKQKKMIKICFCIMLIATYTICAAESSNLQLCSQDRLESLDCANHCRSIQRLHKIQEVGGWCSGNECLCSPVRYRETAV